MIRYNNFWKKIDKVGICKDCSIQFVKSSPRQIMCIDCGNKHKKNYFKNYMVKYKKVNKPKEYFNQKTREWRLRNIDKARLNNRNYVRRIKQTILNHYGNSCDCCGENLYEFLVIDHINGGGNKHRAKEGFKNIYAWLKKMKFPAGYRTLCQNCNSALGFFGYCPHKDLQRHQGLLDSLTLR